MRIGIVLVMLPFALLFYFFRREESQADVMKREGQRREISQGTH